ncbi:MAG: transglycosylase SLT domain-containing protein [Peptostreptococcaceae bacterium]|nr:transglycosylase SLT domain-containing protein [Peptostreptococcaceae bacterium]
MKKISLLILILVLMVSVPVFNVFADAQVKEASSEISEEATAASDNEEEKNIENAPVVPEEEVAEPSIEDTQTLTDTTENTKEQDPSKTKKLNAVKAFIRSKNNKLNDAVVTKVAEAALYANEKNQFDLSLILAVMWKESTFSPNVYNTNCYGIMQIHKNTGAGFGYKVSDLKDPYRAADLGSRILKGHIKNYNSVIMGLTAYNQGTGNVNRGNYNTRYANNVLKKQAVIQAYLEKALTA